MRLLGYDNDIGDIKQPEVTTGQPDKTMCRKSRKFIDEIQDDMIFRKHLSRQLEIKEMSRIL